MIDNRMSNLVVVVVVVVIAVMVVVVALMCNVPQGGVLCYMVIYMTYNWPFCC